MAHLVDVGHPRLLRVARGLDGAETLRAQVREAVGDPVDVLLDGHDHVADHGGLPGPVMVKRFGNPAIARPR